MKLKFKVIFSLLVIIFNNSQLFSMEQPETRTTKKQKVEDPLIAAIQNNDANAIAKAVLAGSDPNRTIVAHNPLAWALLHNNQGLIVLLLANGADPSIILQIGNFSTNFNGFIEVVLKIPAPQKEFLKQLLVSRTSQFIHAVRLKLPAVAKKLLNDNPQLLSMLPEGTTLLHYMAQFASPEGIKILLHYGADIDAQDSSHETPLIKLLKSRDATIENKIEALKTLLSFGPSLQYTYKEFATDPQTGQQIITHSIPFSALYAAINNAIIYPDAINYSELIALLIRHGALIDFQNEYGVTSLMNLLSKESTPNSLHILKLLLDAHPNVNIQDEHDDTALHTAAENNAYINNTPLIIYLLSRPEVKSTINLNLKNEDNETPLMTLFRWYWEAPRSLDNNILQLAKEFLKFPFDINAQDNDGNTALHLAVKNTNYENPEIILAIINLLKQAGADSSIANNQGQTSEEFITKFLEEIYKSKFELD